MELKITARLGERIQCRCEACGKVLVASRSVIPAVVQKAGACPLCAQPYDIRIEHAGEWADDRRSYSSSS